MSRPSATRGGHRRFDVRSADGTPLAVWADGNGPALVLVHGSPSDHTTFDPLVAELRGDFTTFAMDRRGSGDSGDTAPYAIEREFEDVAAVVEAAARSGGPVTLWGHSYGANPAMGGASLTADVRHLILYEPSFGLSYPSEQLAAIEAAVADGDRQGAIRAVFVDTGVMTPEEFEAFMAGPRWPRVLAAALTVPRECRVEHTWTYAPGQFDRITAPTLLLTGSETAAALTMLTVRAAAAIPRAHIRVLPGHGHFAHRSEPALVAGIIRAFVSS
jgi:pimeloyl-ACP methyl ester carboxylesterase